MEIKQSGTGNGNATGTATKEVSFLNRIDLSSPDIHQSVSLLKQVIQFNNLMLLYFSKEIKLKKKNRENCILCVCYS